MKYGYNVIANTFWTDEKVVKWDIDTKLLAAYILSCSHKMTEGIFRIPKNYITADLGMEKERLDKAFAKLLEDDFIKYDEDTNILFITKALKYNAPDNPNQEKSAIKCLERLPKTYLLDEFIASAKKYKESFFERLDKRFGEPQTQTLTHTLTQEQTQKQTQKK